MPNCLVDDCLLPATKKDYCALHYSRWRRHGSPLLGARTRTPDAERFWAKVEKAGPDDCWHWIIQKSKNQYGQFRSYDLKRPIGAHAFSFFLANRYIPPEVMHTCDVRSCVNPKHLKAGTRALNMADMRAKGRAGKTERPRGEAHHGTKLTEDDVRAIRASSETHREAADRYGVEYHVIWQVRARKSFKYVE